MALKGVLLLCKMPVCCLGICKPSRHQPGDRAMAEGILIVMLFLKSYSCVIYNTWILQIHIMLIQNFFSQM